jgi:hypothetical protein
LRIVFPFLIWNENILNEGNHLTCNNFISFSSS